MIQHYIFANADKSSDFVEIGASTLDGQTSVPLDKVTSAFADYSLIEWRLNRLAGKLLTQCDASFADKEQRKAFKDIIRNIIADEFAFYGNHMMSGVIADSLKYVENMSDKEFKDWCRKHPPVEIDEVIAPGK